MGPADEDAAQSVDSYTVSAISNGALFSVSPAVNAAGQLTYIPAPDANGTSTFDVTVTDDGGTANGGVNTSPAQTFTITVTAVNDAPSFTASDPPTILEDFGMQTVAGWVTSTDMGPDNEDGPQSVLSYTVSAISNGALFAVPPAVNGAGQLTYRPAADANGTSDFDVTVTDDGGTLNGGVNTSPAQTFTITVTASNDAPSFTAVDPPTVLEDAGPQTVAGWVTGTDMGPADEDAVQVVDSYTVDNISNGALFAVSPAVDAAGDLTYTPAANANGTSTFDVAVKDDGGTDNVGVDTSPAQTFTVTVTAVNDAPTISDISDTSTYEDTDKNGIAFTADEGGGSDEDAATITVTATSDTQSVVADAGITVNFSDDGTDATGGTIDISPVADAHGTATITVSVDDGVNPAVTDTFVLTVSAVNDVPAFTKGADQSIREDDPPQTVAGWATGISKGPADESGQTLTFNVSTNNAGMFSAGPAIDSTSGNLTYTPGNIGHTATATVTVTLSDNGGTANGGVDTSAAQTFTISIGAVHIITPTVGANGFIVPATPQTLVEGDDITFTITPDTANDYYVVDDVVVDGTSEPGYPLNGSTTYTFTDVQGDHTIHAEFDDHGTGVCFDPTPDDDVVTYDHSGDDTSTVLEFADVESPPPIVVAGNIEPAGDRDFFKLIIPSGGGILTAYTEGTTDTHGTLLTENCDIIRTHDDIDGTRNPNFEIIRNMNAGTYYIQVREGFDTGTGAYTLHLELEPDDHADTCEDAATLLVCDADSIDGEIKPEGDRDYFKIVLTESKLIRVWTTSSGQMDTYGVIYDDNCDEILHNNDRAANDKDFEMEWQAEGPASGVTDVTYYIGVRHLSSRDIGDYTLHIECAEAHKINASADFGGTISPEGAVIVGAGSDETFEIVAGLGNTISEVLVNGVSVNDLAASPSYAKPDGDLNKNTDTTYTFQFTDIDADWTIRAQFNVPPESCVDISDTPLDARAHAAPANIMVLLDDSQSMDWEIMTLEAGGTGVSAGQMTIGNRAYHYLYNMEDRINKTGQGSNVLLDNEERMYWKSQWQGHNKVYYKSSVDFVPWPRKSDVDPDNPPSRPEETEVIANMGDIFATYGDTTAIIYSDNENTGKNNEPETFILSGSWDWATDTTAYGDDDKYYYTPGGITDDYSAAWYPTEIPAGEYEVFTRWVADPGRSESVPYDVYASGVTTTVTVNQTKNGGTWVSLGTYTFEEESGSVSVDLTAYDPDTSGSVSIDAVKFEPTNLPGFEIPISHYYVCEGDEEILWLLDNQDIPYTDGTVCNGQPWLVVIDAGEIKYFRFDDANLDDKVDNGELTEVAEASVPASVKTDRTYDEERQNFANWFTYYRKRDLLTRAAVSRVITDMKGVKVGLRGLEGLISVPVQPIKVNNADETAFLLEELYVYSLESQGAATSSSPVRRAFEDVGQYFDMADDDDGDIGPSPIASYEDGGGCQQNFAIIFSDAYYNGLPAGAVELEDSTPGEFSGFAPYKSGVNNTLADIAMNYYARDLAPEVEDEVPTNPYDSASHQHLVTYTVTFGVIGTLNPDDYDVGLCEEEHTGDYDYEADIGDPEGSPCPPWPQINSDTKKIDDLWHAAVNGRGEFHSASDVEELIEAFKAVLQNIEARIGSAASVSVNGDELYGALEADIRMYQSSYSTDGWTGDVKAYEVDLNTGEVITDTYVFSAASMLEDLDWNTGRLIATWNGSEGAPFREDSLTDEQKAYLYDGWESSGVTVSDIVDYLRGDNTKEEALGGEFRDRFQKLGDIVHSSPVFKNDVLYTGGNDGMLHAFSAVNGEELFAYVPNHLYENLSRLPDPSYAHTYYVDLTPVTKDIEVDDGEGGTEWKSVLVGGLAKGGKGYYAIDITGVTDSYAISTETELSERIMWEYPESGVTDIATDDLGFTYSRPVLVKSNDPNLPWIMVIGNGYNSMSSHSVLLILDPETGTLIKKIDTGEPLGYNLCNGLSTPIVVDYDYDSTADYAYAGDLQGYIWKFDLTSDDYNDWGVAFGDDTNGDGQINYDAADGGSADTPQPLFRAMGPGNEPQPITTKPDVMFHCEANGFMVVFGTGRYLGESDFTNSDVQSLYGIWDYGDDDDNDEYLGEFQRGAAQQLSNQPAVVTMLEQSEIPGDFTTSDGKPIRVLTNYEPIWATVVDPDTDQEPDIGSPATCTDGDDNDGDEAIDETDECITHAGWFYDVPAGERIANDIIIRAGKIVSIGFVPEETPCGTGGSSVVMELDACSGGRLKTPQLDINEDGVVDESDVVNIGTEEDPEWVPASGIVYEGRLMPPAILQKGEEEIKYFSTNVGNIVTLTEKGVKLGLSYWIELD